MACLWIETGSKAGLRLDLCDKPVVAGRHTGCDLVLNDDAVSRRHARFSFRRGEYYVEDLGSLNGTFVNGQPVRRAQKLADGDRIQLYGVGIRFQEGCARPKSMRSTVFLMDELDNAERLTKASHETLAEVSLLAVNPPTADSRLAALLDVSGSLQQCVEPAEQFQQVLTCLFRALPQIDRGCILRVEARGKKLVLEAIQVRAGDQPSTIGPIAQALVKASLEQRKAMLTDDVADDCSEDSIHVADRRSVMCAPLMDSGSNAIGVVYVDSVARPCPFANQDLDVLACVAMLAAQALEQATLHNTRYRTVFDTSGDGIITFSSDGTIQDANAAAARLFHYEQEELRGMQVASLIPDLAAWTGRGFQLEDRRGEALGRRRNGATTPISLAIGEYRLGGRTCYSAIVHDITQQKLVERTLKTLNEHLEREVHRRTEYVELHQDVAVIANTADTVASAFRAVLKRIHDFTSWQVGHVLFPADDGSKLFVDANLWGAWNEGVDVPSPLAVQQAFAAGSELVALVASSAQVHWTRDFRGDDSWTNALAACGLHCGVAFPVHVGDDVVAIVEFFAAEVEPPDVTLLDVLRHVGTQLGRVIERRRLQQELVDAVWDQQRAFGQELHDTLSQELTGIGMLANSVARRLELQDAPDAGTVRELAQMIQQAKQDTRRFAKGLLPVEVDACGLWSAIEELAESTRRRCAIDVELCCESDAEFEDNSLATHLFRIAQEAVTNAVKHAEATRVRIEMAEDPSGALILTIADNGSGLPPLAERAGRGVGLRIMDYRAHTIGAELDIRDANGGGTVVACRIQRRTDYEHGILGTSR